MKSISVFLLTFLVSLNCFSQSLEGEWKGTFAVDNPSFQLPVFYNQGFITLKFILNEDSSYTVYSYCKLDTIVVSEVLYKRISKDSIYLEETKVIKPKHEVQKCFQKMNLEIRERKKSIELIGRFNFLPGNLCGAFMPETWFGSIRFYKKKEEKK